MESQLALVMSPPDLDGSVSGLEAQSKTPVDNYTSWQSCALTRCCTQASDQTQHAISLSSSTPSSLTSPEGSGSLTWPTSRSPTAPHDYPVTVPDLKQCAHCEYRGSSKSLAAHLRPERPGYPSPCSLPQRIPCSTPDEPGCTENFGSERERKRHREQSCKMLPHLQSYRCGCGRQVKRWNVFKNSHSTCEKPKKMPYACPCREHFSSFLRLKAHHDEVHQGKKGRPPKKG